MRQYKLDPKPIGTGSFGIVYKATHLKTEKTYAIKLLKHEFETSDDVHRLPEVQVMRRVGTHPNILRLHEVLYNRSNKQAALVTDLMSRDLYQEMCQYKKKQEYIPEEIVSHYLYFLLKGVQHLHKLNIFHRDLKPENVLVDGDGGLKIADLGSVKGIFKKPPHTEYTATRWYRAPEVLLSSGCYGYKMDLWAVGCIFFELMALDPLFPGDKEDSTLELIHAIRGTPSKTELAQIDGVLDGPYVPTNGLQFRAHSKKDFSKILHFYQPSSAAIDLLEKLLCYNPADRISAKDALKHSFFAKIRSLEKEVKKTPSPTLTAEEDDGRLPQVHPQKLSQPEHGEKTTEQKKPSLPQLPTLPQKQRQKNSLQQALISPSAASNPVDLHSNDDQRGNTTGGNSASDSSSCSSLTQQHIDPLSTYSSTTTSSYAPSNFASTQQNKYEVPIPEGLPPLNFHHHTTASTQKKGKGGESKTDNKSFFNTTVPLSKRYSSSSSDNDKKKKGIHLLNELSNATSVALPPLQPVATLTKPSSLQLKKRNSRADTPVPLTKKDDQVPALPPLPY